jgi:hypothetical protein
MPKMQVRGTQSFFGDVQDVRYAENAGTWYPELFRRCSWMYGTPTMQVRGTQSLSVQRQFCAGVFSAKYSWLSAFFTACVGLLSASDLAAD